MNWNATNKNLIAESTKTVKEMYFSEADFSANTAETSVSRIKKNKVYISFFFMTFFLK